MPTADARYVKTTSEVADELVAMLDRTATAGYRLITTGHPELDDELTIYPGSMSVVVGRPGMGKSMLLKSIAAREHKRILDAGTKNDECVVFVTLEEPKTKLCIQIGQLPITWRDAVRGTVADREAARMAAVYLPKTLPALMIIEHPGLVDGKVAEPLSAERVLTAIEQIYVEFGKRPTLVCLDYLQLLKGQGQPYTVKAKTEHVMAASQGALNLARSLQVPVVLAVQAARDADGRMPPLPRMSDMQWASQIEQDADNIIGLCRPAALESIQDEIANMGHATVDIAGVSHTVTDSLMMLGVVKARNDGCVGRRYAAHLHPERLTLHGVARNA